VTSPPTEFRDRPLRRAPSIVLVHTGDGKGKTTAAMGVVLRGVARGWRVLVIQFVKSDEWRSGEADVLERLGVEWHTMGDGFTWEVEDLGRSAELTRVAWELAKSAIAGGQYDLVLLDEVTYPITWGWIDERDVIATLAGRPEQVNVVLTGRDATDGVIAIADTVSEVRNVKHAFDQGIRAKKGIDY
jgi:cob(I)alamin adenosyltransferase